jgi:hypothetical protein
MPRIRWRLKRFFSVREGGANSDTDDDGADVDDDDVGGIVDALSACELPNNALALESTIAFASFEDDITCAPLACCFRFFFPFCIH